MRQRRGSHSPCVSLCQQVEAEGERSVFGPVSGKWEKAGVLRKKRVDSESYLCHTGKLIL